MRCSISPCIIFLIGLIWKDSLSCQVMNDDTVIIKGILERSLVRDDLTLARLSGVFFQDQQRPPHSVWVTYRIQVPYNSQCISECSCWKDACNSTDCEPGYCCFERDFLWGRKPMYIQDSIFRQLTMCGFVIGGIKEKTISIPLNISNESWGGQCSLCQKPSDGNGGLNVGISFRSQKLGTDSLIAVWIEFMSPLDQALLTITAKVCYLLIVSRNAY